MCLLIVSEKEFPSSELLSLGNQQNRDGAGVAWVEDGKVKWKKGLKLAELEALRERIKGPNLVHFRLSTVGGNRPDLCHPFAINQEASTELEGETDVVLAHNGHWAGFSRELLLTLDYNIELPAGPWSDTRAMAWLAHIKGVNFLGTINEKVAVLDKTGTIRVFNQPQFYRVNESTLSSYNPFTRVTKGNKTTTTTYNKTSSYSTYDDWEGCESHYNSSPSFATQYKTGSFCSMSGIANYNSPKKYEGRKLPKPMDA